MFISVRSKSRYFIVGYLIKPFTVFLISNFRRVLNVVFFLVGNFPASEFCMPTFRNTLFHLYKQVGIETTFLHLPAYEDGTDRVFRNVGV